MTDTFQITCWKYPFDTAKEAHQAREMAKGRRRRRPLDGCLAYCCPDCGKWHLGHPPMRINRAKRWTGGNPKRAVPISVVSPPTK